MRTSLFEIQQIEEHLLHGAQLPDHLHGSADVATQAYTYGIVQAYGRRQLKEELGAIHSSLFAKGKWSRFKRRVMRCFR